MINRHLDDEKALRARLETLLASYVEADDRTAHGTRVQPHVSQILRDAIDRGYRLWPSHEVRNKPNTSHPFMLAKMFRNERGDKLYQICLDVWDFDLEFDGRLQGDQWLNISPTGHFNLPPRRGPGARSVNLKPFLADHHDTLDQIERLFADFYERMGCVPSETTEDA